MSAENAVLISGCLIGARELILELGADADAIAHEARLPARAFEDPELFVQARCIFDYLELAAAACFRGDFGLMHARRLPLGMLGAGWMIMRAASTIEEALIDFVRLYGLYTDAGTLRAERAHDGLWLESSFLPVGRFGCTQTVVLTLGCICLFVRENLPRTWRPRRVAFRHEPTAPEAFVEFFGPGIVFGQERDAIFIDRPTLSSPMGLGAERRALHEAMLRQTAGRGIAVVAQVKSLLRTLMRCDACGIDTISEALTISPRTLQRRLALAGTSYFALVDEVRADLAWHHVKRSELNLGRIAELLGYRSSAAFSRAFRRWHGVNPRAARRG